MKKTIWILVLLFSLPAVMTAGPYPPAAETAGSHAIHLDDTAILYWAAGYEDYQPGSNVNTTWQAPENALGKAEGTSFDVVSLGRGGQITLVFDPPIEDGEGWDFAVFENSFNDTNLELAYVEVSSNGEDFIRFDAVSLTSNPIGAYGAIDPTDINGLAGKFRQGYGVPFDLRDLTDRPEVLSEAVDLSAVTYIKIRDIIGDGTFFDSEGYVIYDPFPTTTSAGFDLDAIGVSNGAAYPDGEFTLPSVPSDTSDPPSANGEAGFGDEGGCFLISVLRGT